MNKRLTTILSKIFTCPKKRRRRELEQAKKVWNKYETYNKGDVVEFSTSSYVAIDHNILNVEPGSIKSVTILFFCNSISKSFGELGL